MGSEIKINPKEEPAQVNGPGLGLLPASIGLFLDSVVLGNRAPVTSSALSRAELIALEAAIQNAEAAGRDYIVYGDYAPGTKAGVNVNDLFGAQQSVASTIGMARFFRNAKTGEISIKDKYDWNISRAELDKEVKKAGGVLQFVTAKMDAANMAERLGAVAMPEGEGRRVDVRWKPILPRTEYSPDERKDTQTKLARGREIANYLAELQRQPQSYSLQYQLKDGKLVETVIRPPAAAVGPQSRGGVRRASANLTPVGEEPNIMQLTDKEAEVLAYTLLGEAGGEGRAGMAAVMNVIKNRTESGRYSDNPAAVALQKNARGIHQFSTWNTKENGGNQPISRYRKSSKEFKEALDIVEKVMAGEIPDETGGATHFVTKALFDADKPGWWDAEAPAGEKQIGNHVFGVRVAQQTAASAAAALARAKAANIPLDTPAPLSFPIDTPSSTAQRGAGAATFASRAGDNGGELVTRIVTTVRIDPVTGLPVRAANTANNRVGRAASVAAANANLNQARVEQAAQRRAAARRDLGTAPAGGVSGTYRDGGAIPARQVIIKPDGTVQEVQVARTVAMPRDARPSLPGDVPKNVSYQTTVKVKNPNYVPNISGSPDDRDVTNALKSKLMAGAAGVGAAAQEPEFIEKVVTLQRQITVPGTPLILAAPRVPVVAPRAPNSRVIEQDQELRAELGKKLAEQNRRSPNPTYDVSGGDNAFNPRSVQESLRWQTGY